ncbi:hypothetical protein C4K04_2721 [Pseudomonas chlororaphis]|uniref:Uncharacterized protein n=1 Tax=Pseudomonas chlororaphis TaxID=587753 RepID=A0A3G7TMS4_9PSED|nr:hypothetical protein C4K04_2721 [Pseudomonas chlororaphis]
MSRDLKGLKLIEPELNCARDALEQVEAFIAAVERMQ